MHYMSATEVIDQFKRLPKSGQAKVVPLNQTESSDRLPYANDSVVEAAANAVFEEHPELFNKLAQ